MAVMASEAPLEPMSFSEKAHPAPATATIPMETDINGSANHYDALFDEPAIPNGTHPDPMESHDPLATKDGDASKILTAEDASAAPVTEVTSGISAVASFLPERLAEAHSDAIEPPATSTVPPAVEQPESDVRDEPLDEHQAAVVEELEPKLVDSGTAMDLGSEDAAPAKREVSATEDAMDTTDDAAPHTAESASNINASNQEPVPSIENVPQAAASQAPSQFADTPISKTEPAPTGQVRPREEDEDMGPAPKRAKTGSTDEGLPPPASKEPASSIKVKSNSTSTPAHTASSALASQPAVDVDSNPMTPTQQKFLLEQLRKAKKIKSSMAFLRPVDYMALNIPTYPEIIKKPMDLSTMEDKLKGNKYRTANDFMADFELIIQNSLTFNGPNHVVSVAGMNLKAYFVKIVSGIPKGPEANPVNVEVARPKKSAAPPPKPPPRPERRVTAKSPVDKPAGFLNEHGMPIIRRDSSAQNDRPKREIHPPKRDLPSSGARPKKKKHQLELKFCESVLNEIGKKKYASFSYPFMQPVDPVALNIPNYHKIIKKPMDFGTVQINLKNGEYSNAKEFYTDGKLVFQNCYKFNPPTDEVHKMGKLLEELFDKVWAGKDQWLTDNAPNSEPPSDAEDEDDEEEEEEPEDEAVRKLQEIQQQIAALSAEALKLTTTGKRASPKAPVSKGKSVKAGPAKVKRMNSTVGLPVAAKSAKSKTAKQPKPKKLTLDQKREVSEGIANLDEGQMRKAVQIIRNGVPHLRNVQDDELELDIDEIPDDVVYQLYQFVRAKVPRDRGHADHDLDDEDDEFEVGQKPAANRKKNKPMKATEQEERIKNLQAQLQYFRNNSGSEHSPDNHQDDSSDDDASESSEEE